MGSQYQVMGVTTTPEDVEVYPFPLTSAVPTSEEGSGGSAPDRKTDQSPSPGSVLQPPKPTIIKP